LCACFLPVYSSLPPRPPTSPPFPYTTLFRSTYDFNETPSESEAAAVPASETALESLPASTAETALESQPDTNPETSASALPVSGDRKSTRLNSSHVSISYAVFCLKKNNRRTK